LAFFRCHVSSGLWRWLPDSILSGMFAPVWFALCRDHWNLGRRPAGCWPMMRPNAFHPQPHGGERCRGLVRTSLLALCAISPGCAACASPRQLQPSRSLANPCSFPARDRRGDRSASGSKGCVGRNRPMECVSACCPLLVAGALFDGSGTPVGQRRVFPLPFHSHPPQSAPEAV